MKTKLIILIFCFFVNGVFARKIITGRVIGLEDKAPIETAIVDLIKLPDSVKVETFYTNTEGLYTFTKVDTTKNYCLKIAKSFFKTQIVPVVLNSTNKIINIGNTLLVPSIYNLKEITVNGSKIQVKELPDRTIYGISTDMKKTSTDGLDVLRKVPTVQVDYFNENITVEGKSNVVIEVDGITRDKSFLKKLHPTQVSKLEVITNPTGKYDADVDAVINIITDKEMRYGLKGMFNGVLLPNSLDNYMSRGNASLDYGLKKISFYVSGNGGIGKIDFINNMDRTSGINGLNREGDSKINFRNGNANAGFIYDPNELNNLSVNVAYNGSGSISNNYQLNDISLNNSLVSKNESYTNSDNVNSGLNSSIYYKHKFDKKKDHSLEFETNLNTSLKNLNTSNYQYIFLDQLGTELSRSPLQFEENNTRSSSLNSRVNYNLPFDSVFNFNSGINANYNYNYIDNIRSGSNVPNLEYINLKGSLFAELNKTFKKGSAKLGSRFEVSKVTINISNINNYFSLLPYANFQYKFNDNNTLKFNYSRRVFRPSNSQLNPFVSYVDSLTESHGNINLKPAYRDNFQLTHSIKYGKNKFSGNITPQLFYEYRTGLIQDITKQKDGSSIFEKYPVNISNGYQTGLNLSVYAQISVVIFNSNFRYFKTHIDNYLDQIPAIDLNSWSWSSQLMCPLPKEFRVFAVLSINGPSVNGQVITQNAPFYLLGLSKQFKNNSSLTLLALNPFARRMFYNSSVIDNSYLYQKTESYMGFRNAFMINYSINFKVGKDLNLQKLNQEQNQDDNMLKLPF
ncbi:MAG: outer membrane beta-barrel family protein [Paludibacter sp.]